MSPGELRLDHDLCQLLGWNRVHERIWVHHHRENIRLDRIANDPLRLVLHVGNARVSLQFSRLYPHEPPVVVHLENCIHISNFIVSLVDPNQQHTHNNVQEQQNYDNNDYEMAMETTPTTQQHHGEHRLTKRTVTYNQWSPIRRLDELLHFIIDALEQDSRSIITMPSTTTTTTTTTPMRHKHDAFFAPNRFDIGYDRSTSNSTARPMEC